LQHLPSVEQQFASVSDDACSWLTVVAATAAFPGQPPSEEQPAFATLASFLQHLPSVEQHFVSVSEVACSWLTVVAATAAFPGQPPSDEQPDSATLASFLQHFASLAASSEDVSETSPAMGQQPEGADDSLEAATASAFSPQHELSASALAEAPQQPWPPLVTVGVTAWESAGCRSNPPAKAAPIAAITTTERINSPFRIAVVS